MPSPEAVPECPADKLDCRTRSQVNGEGFYGDLNMHTVIDATRQRVQGRMGSKEVAYLCRLLSNGGLDHSGRAVAVSLVARAYSERRKPRGALLRCRGQEPYGLIFQLGMGLVLSLATLGAW